MAHIRAISLVIKSVVSDSDRIIPENHVNNNNAVANGDDEPNIKDLCHINVCGEHYITTFSVLNRYPSTLLGSHEREKYFCPDLNAYFFNRNRACFESILLFYQTGEDYPPLNADPALYVKEKEFFKIRNTPELAIEIVGSTDVNIFDYCDTNFQKRRKKIHSFLMDPRSSAFATVWHSIDILFICVSISFLVMETDPNIGKHFTDRDDPYYMTLFCINGFVIVFFTLDIVVRFITWPGLFSFWKSLFNILDILSILPFYVSIIADSMSDGLEDDDAQKSYVVLRVCRIFRIVRIFKFVRHSRDLVMILRVVVHARKELCLLVLLLGIFTMTFGSIMYYVEQDANPQFNSIMTGCWWAIVTITTIGYGDISPVTAGGKLVGSVVLTLGIVFLALPMTIIVSKFSSVYEKEKVK